jgi:4'-phosphopantetheinyl transferase
VIVDRPSRIALAEWEPAPSDVPRPGRSEVHLWAAPVDREPREASVATLSPEERARADRFRLDHDRHRWVGAHALLRTAVARTLSCPPHAVVFRSTGQREKPSIARPWRGRTLHFNLSHAGALAVVAVARRDVGVDVAMFDDTFDVLAVAARALPPEVGAELRLLPAEQREPRFIEHWVRHEARAKCLGTGIVEPGDDDGSPVAVIDVPVGGDHAAALACDRVPTRVRRWQVAV